MTPGHWMPPVTEDGVSTYFLAINRNKRSVALDLKDDGDLALAQELASRADVFVQNFKPGGLRRYGLDYDAVSALNPAVIYASISGFGSAGGKDCPGYDLMVQAMSGLMSLTGDPDGPPYRAGISAFDVIAGLHTTIAILAALNHRNATGEGQHLEASPDGVGDVRHGEPDQRVRGGRRGAVPHGQLPPQPVPLRAAAHRGRRPDRHGGQRRAVPQAVRRPRRARARPTTRGSPPTRAGPRTATSSGRCSPRSSPPSRPASGSTR